MIDAKYLEALREANRRLGASGEVIVSVGMFDELCRVYLDWLEAPEELVGKHWDGHGEIYPDEYMIGKRVRLVEVKE